MARRRLLTGVLLAGGSLVGSILIRRRATRRREHVDLYLEDGSMLSLADDTTESESFLGIAHDLLPGSR